MITQVFQTLEDRNNPDYIEDNGPFICRLKGAWLGIGYYFWDSRIDLAHKWGENYPTNGYIICQAQLDISAKCLDLVGNIVHNQEFREVAETLLKENVFLFKEITFANVINYMIKTDTFKFNGVNFEGIRAHPIKSFNLGQAILLKTINVVQGKSQFIDLDPHVQICLLKKNSLDLEDFRIIYPEEYAVDYI